MACSDGAFGVQTDLPFAHPSGEAHSAAVGQEPSLADGSLGVGYPHHDP